MEVGLGVVVGVVVVVVGARAAPPRADSRAAARGAEVVDGRAHGGQAVQQLAVRGRALAVAVAQLLDQVHELRPPRLPLDRGLPQQPVLRPRRGQLLVGEAPAAVALLLHAVQVGCRSGCLVPGTCGDLLRSHELTLEHLAPLLECLPFDLSYLDALPSVHVVGPHDLGDVPRRGAPRRRLARDGQRGEALPQDAAERRLATEPVGGRPVLRLEPLGLRLQLLRLPLDLCLLLFKTRRLHLQPCRALLQPGGRPLSISEQQRAVTPLPLRAEAFFCRPKFSGDLVESCFDIPKALLQGTLLRDEHRNLRLAAPEVLQSSLDGRLGGLRLGPRLRRVRPGHGLQLVGAAVQLTDPRPHSARARHGHAQLGLEALDEGPLRNRHGDLHPHARPHDGDAVELTSYLLRNLALHRQLQRSKSATHLRFQRRPRSGCAATLVIVLGDTRA
mmetsp:Transcript_103711/g.332393  ORF Transcript_103711/g.332393 Transcript_103711/m.332393 type:complete len:445 (-) Transcript_103711:999-2333(-)